MATTVEGLRGRRAEAGSGWRYRPESGCPAVVPGGRRGPTVFCCAYRVVLRPARPWWAILPTGTRSSRAATFPGTTSANAALVVHLAMAALVTFGGPLQLIPQIRAHFPAFHRWTGRAYIAVASVGERLGLVSIPGSPWCSREPSPTCDG